MGSRLGGGSEAQSKALGAFAEALGIAFQIVDDVLNLRGFVDGLKTKGEDITAGKVPYPVAVAMSRLEKADRAELWEIVSSKPEDIEKLSSDPAAVRAFATAMGIRAKNDRIDASLIARFTDARGGMSSEIDARIEKLRETTNASRLPCAKLLTFLVVGICRCTKSLRDSGERSRALCLVRRALRSNWSGRS